MNKDQEPLLQRILQFIREQRLIPRRQRLVVAVSGGADSVCLLHVLLQLQKELNIKLHVAHLNHQLRGAESEADARYVSELAEKLGITATIEARDVKAYRARQRISLEEAAREVRYSFLGEVARSVGASRVAVGHTTDDHVETILMHLIRGTGTKGLRGLQPVTRWQATGGGLTVIRPLLPVSREETTGYCHSHQLMPRIDASNLSLSPFRNKIRLQLLPLLKSYNPQVVEALVRAARIAGDDYDFLNGQSTRLWKRVAERQESTIIFEKKGFLRLAPALQRYILMEAVEELLGSLKDIEARHIEDMMAALGKPAGKRLVLPEGLVFIVEYERYLLTLEPEALSPFPALDREFALKIPGETILPGWRVTATIVSASAFDMAAKSDRFTAYLDFDKAGDSLSVRSRRQGDTFQPLGMSQPKKVGEFMVDSRIPRAWRERVPIVCSLQQILWVAGWRIDDGVKVTEETKRILRLEFKLEDRREGQSWQNG